MAKIIAVDFDGTIVENAYPFIGNLRRGIKYPKFIDDLIELRKRGYKLILWTCRTGIHLQDAVSFCKSYGLEFDAVNDDLEDEKALWTDKLTAWRDTGMARKIFAHYYIDDRAVELNSLPDFIDCASKATTSP